MTQSLRVAIWYIWFVQLSSIFENGIRLFISIIAMGRILGNYGGWQAMGEDVGLGKAIPYWNPIGPAPGLNILLACCIMHQT